MKTTLRMILLLISLILCLSTLVACGDPAAVPQNDNPPAEDPGNSEFCFNVDATWRIIVSSDADETVQKAAAAVADALKEKAGLELLVLTDAEAAVDNEIVLGKTNRCDAPVVDGKYSVLRNGDSLHIYAEDPLDLYYAVLAVTEVWLTSDFGLSETGVVILPESRISELNGLSTKRDTSLKVMSQNVRCADDPNNNSVIARSKRFKKLVNEYQPDLIGTQETTKEWKDLLKKYLDEEYSMVGVSRDGKGATTGEWNSVLFRKDRFELIKSDTVWLSSTPSVASKLPGTEFNRICTWVLLKDKLTGETILFANTHLDHIDADTYRIQQMQILLNYLADKVGEYPLYLTGDFNCGPDSEPYAAATAILKDSRRDAWVDASTVNNTYHAYTVAGIKEIDFVFYNEKATPIKYEIISKEYGGFVSDHYGVMAEFIS